MPNGSQAAMVDDHGDSGPEVDRISLRFPADAQFSRVARVAVSAVALRMRLETAVVEELRIAVDEALILLLREAPGGPEPASPEEAADGSSPPSRPEEFHLLLDARPALRELDVSVELGPAASSGPPSAAMGPDISDASRRFEEILPPRVEARRVDPAHGVVALALR